MSLSPSIAVATTDLHRHPHHPCCCLRGRVVAALFISPAPVFYCPRPLLIVNVPPANRLYHLLILMPLFSPSPASSPSISTPYHQYQSNQKSNKTRCYGSTRQTNVKLVSLCTMDPSFSFQAWSVRSPRGTGPVRPFLLPWTRQGTLQVIGKVSSRVEITI